MIYDPSNPLISIHIPKCAGTSFSRVLRQWFGRRLLRHYVDEKTRRMPVKHSLVQGFVTKRPRVGICIHGHFNRVRGTGVEDYYPEARQLITVVREPYELHVSTYFFVRKAWQQEEKGTGAFRDGKPHPIIEHDWSLMEYLRNRPRSYLLEFFPRDMNLENYRQILSGRYLVVGVAERLQDSVDKMADVLGFQSVRVPTENVSPRDSEVSPETRAEFAERNPLEMAVYRYALSRLDAGG